MNSKYTSSLNLKFNHFLVYSSDAQYFSPQSPYSHIQNFPAHWIHTFVAGPVQ